MPLSSAGTTLVVVHQGKGYGVHYRNDGQGGQNNRILIHIIIIPHDRAVVFIIISPAYPVEVDLLVKSESEDIEHEFDLLEQHRVQKYGGVAITPMDAPRSREENG